MSVFELKFKNTSNGQTHYMEVIATDYKDAVRQFSSTYDVKTYHLLSCDEINPLREVTEPTFPENLSQHFKDMVSSKAETIHYNGRHFKAEYILTTIQEVQ